MNTRRAEGLLVEGVGVRHYNITVVANILFIIYVRTGVGSTHFT